MTALSRNFSENFKTHLTNLFKDPFLAALQPVECVPTTAVKSEFIQISGRAT